MATDKNSTLSNGQSELFSANQRARALRSPQELIPASFPFSLERNIFKKLFDATYLRK